MRRCGNGLESHVCIVITLKKIVDYRHQLIIDTIGKEVLKHHSSLLLADNRYDNKRSIVRKE